MRAVKYALATLATLAALLLVWGLVQPYFIAVEEGDAEISGLPAAWEGERVGLISDWQIGMWLDNTPTMRRSVDLLVEERPAAVLIAGRTHGGRISAPFTAGWSYLAPPEEGETAVAGRVDDLGEPDTRLYVSRGIGFGLTPTRINHPPEVTLFTLRSPG